MKWFYFLMVVLCFGFLHAQDDEIRVEESAEVFLEEYSDDFQETFFNAIKQKGIQNYDRAINLFLECKQLKSNEVTIDHELAKTYLLNRKYTSAEDYAIAAVKAEPENYWYLATLVEVLEKQGKKVASLSNSIPLKEQKLIENLATIFFKKNQFSVSENYLKQVKSKAFVEELEAKIQFAKELLAKRSSLRKEERVGEKVRKTTEKVASNDPMQNLRTKIEGFIANSDYKGLEENAKEAYEAYPLQPYFYFAYGLALNKKGKSNEAIEILESGLDYIFDHSELSNKIYKELANAYNSEGKPEKAKEYLSKIKNGL